MSKRTTVKIGTFEVKSGAVICSDPCYKRDTWCQGVLKNVKKGKWLASIVRSNEGEWGSRVAELIAVHSVHAPIPESNDWNVEKFDVGVDSGQAGIFDDKSYRGGEDEYGYGGWYDKCCDLTLKTEGGHQILSAGVLEGGVVSSSGYGDGCYDCFTIKNNGKIVGIRIVFMI